MTGVTYTHTPLPLAPWGGLSRFLHFMFGPFLCPSSASGGSSSFSFYLCKMFWFLDYLVLWIQLCSLKRYWIPSPSTWKWNLLGNRICQTKLCTVRKTKEKEVFIARGFHLETQGSESNEFWVAHKLGVLMRQTWKWFAFFIWLVAEGFSSLLDRGEQASPDLMWADLVAVRSTEVLCWFLRRAENSVT